MVQIYLYKSTTQRPHAVTALVIREVQQHLHNIQRWQSKVVDPDYFVERYMAVLDNAASDDVKWTDAFSNGQLNSKLWLISQLEDIDVNLGKIWIMCGWIGTLAYLMIGTDNRLKFDSIRSFDIDPFCQPLSDTLNRSAVMDGWKFKASTMDVNHLSYDNFFWNTTKFNGEVERMFDSADTVINTSCEHLSDFEGWFGKIPDGKLVVLQCNNSPDLDGHVNNMNSLYELANRARCKRVYFKGTLDCDVYERYMLIGRK
jgi:hypothetical protein